MSESHPASESERLSHTDPLQVLVEASASLPDASDLDSVLTRILASAQQLIAADAYAIWRTYDEGETWQTLASQGLSNEYSFTANRPGVPIPPGPIVAVDVSSVPFLALRAPMYEREGIRSLLTVPLVIDGNAAGTIAFYYRKPHWFTEREVQYATALANLAAAALRIAELQAAQQQERRRLAFLAEASALLSSSLDYEATLRRVTQLAVPHIGDWCSVNIVQGDTLVPLAVAHVDPQRIALAEEFCRRYPESLREETATVELLHRGESQLLRFVPDEALVAAATDEEHLRMLRELRLASIITVPLQTRGRCFGLLRLATAESGRLLDKDDLHLAEDLARRASVAIDNANLYRDLREGEERYRTLVAATAALVFQTDPLAQFSEPQHDWTAYTGQTWEEHQNLGWANALHPEDRSRVLEHAMLSVHERRLQQVSARLWHAASRDYRHIVVRAVPLLTTEGTVREWVGTITDVHDQRHAEETLRRTEKLAAAGRLAATVAHEINNPLEAVTNLLYIAQRSSSLDDATRRNLAVADEELQRVAHIVRQTLGFYREATAPRATDLGMVIGDVLDLYRRRARDRKIELITDIPEGITPVVVAGEIKQVVANLIANAIDSISPPGRIRVTVRADAENSEIVIADTGAGIEQDKRPRLFEPFFTTKKDIGTGLGLWVSKGIVEKHRGSIIFESSTDAVEHGTRFVVTLPMTMPDGIAPRHLR
jgi:PAS domain S-box-containing protein